MSGDWEYTKQEDEAKAEVKEGNEFKPSTLQQSVRSDEKAKPNTNIDEDQESKMLPENNEEQGKGIKVELATLKSLPRATTTTMGSMDKRKKKNIQHRNQKQRKKTTTMANISKRLHKQDIEIKKLKSVLQSQFGAIKKLKKYSKQNEEKIVK